MNDDLAAHLARRARALGLDVQGVEDADPGTLREFARAVLSELSALGLIRGDEEVGCWAGPRSPHH